MIGEKGCCFGVNVTKILPTAIFIRNLNMSPPPHLTFSTTSIIEQNCEVLVTCAKFSKCNSR